MNENKLLLIMRVVGIVVIAVALIRFTMSDKVPYIDGIFYFVTISFLVVLFALAAKSGNSREP